MTDASYTPPVTMDPDAEAMDRERRGLDGLQTSQGLALRETFDEARSLTGRVIGFIGADNERRFDAQRRRMFGEDAPQLVAPAEANARYGVPGHLTFDAPVDRNIAEWRQGQAMAAAFREEVVGNADLDWWQSMGAGIAGSLVDPIQWPLWLVPEAAAGRWLAGSRIASGLRPLVGGALRGGVEGVAGSVLYEGLNYGLHRAADDDYSLGAASMNVIFGGVLGATVGAGGGWWEARNARRARMPAVMEALTEDQRIGAFMQALDDVSNDRPVDLTPVLRRAIERGDLRAPGAGETRGNVLDEAVGRMEGRRFDFEPGVVDQGAQAFFIRPGRALAEAEGLGLDDMVFGWAEDGALRIERANLRESARGKGLGLEMYARALRAAREAAVDLISDREVSPAAERVWRALARRGVQVEEAADTFRAKPGGVLQSRDGGPVFRVRAARAAGTPVADTARDLTDKLNAWYGKAGGEPGPVAAPKAAPARAVAEPAGAERGPKPKAPKGAPVLPKGQPLADPEVAALAADTEAMLAREGLTLEGEGPSLQGIADAITAGAACLARAA